MFNGAQCQDIIDKIDNNRREKKSFIPGQEGGMEPQVYKPCCSKQQAEPCLL